MEFILNPIVISVVVLCALCLARVNVLLALIAASLVAGLTGGLGLTKSMELLSGGFSANATTALSYILLGTFAVAIAHTGLMQMLVRWIGAKMGGRPLVFCFGLAFIACLSQNVVPVHIAFIPLLIPPLLKLMNKMKLDRRAVSCALGFGLTAPYVSLPIGFGLIFQGIVAQSMTQNGMAAGDALQLYGVLTIGDGLVSQIPSLLVSISAGILITRSGDTAEDVGAQVGRQFFDQPRAMQMAGGLIFLLALIPGFPKPQLFTMAFAVYGFGMVLAKLKNAPAEPDKEGELKKTLAPVGSQQRKKAVSGGDEFSPTVPIILDISPDISESMDYDTLNAELVELRHALYFDLGVPFPGINIRPNPNLTSFSYSLNLNEIPIAHGQLVKGYVIVRESKANLNLLGIKFIEGNPFLPNVDPIWVPKEDVARLTQAGISCMDHARILAYHLSLLLTRHAETFIGMQETKYLLDRMEERAPDLVREVTRLLPVQRIADIFQRLVQEHISIRDLRTILQALIEWAPKEKDVVMLTEYVRGSLKRQISFMYSKGQNMLPVILMEPQVEETIRKAIRQTSAGAFLSLDPGSSQRILDAVERAAGRFRNSTQKPVLMVSMDIRRYVRRLIEPKFYELPVMAYQEVTPDITVQPVARIRV